MLCNLLRLEGHRIGHKHVQTLMKKMGVEVLHRKLNTSQHHAAHTVYPYLPCNVSIDRPNQAWASDITYIPMRRGFVYLVAVIDWYSCRVLSWRLSNTLTAVLYRGTQRGPCPVWPFGDLQYGPWQPVH